MKKMAKTRLLQIGTFVVVSCGLCAAAMYSRYIDWPSFGANSRVRAYIPAPYPISETYHYTYRSFMDTWELYRFSTTPEAIAFLADDLRLADPVTVFEFPLIVSRPPPYWWHPEHIPEAELYRSLDRAPDGHLYDLLYSQETGVAYLIRFDG